MNRRSFLTKATLATGASFMACATAAWQLLKPLKAEPPLNVRLCHIFREGKLLPGGPFRFKDVHDGDLICVVSPPEDARSGDWCSVCSTPAPVAGTVGFMIVEVPACQAHVDALRWAGFEVASPT